MSSFWKCKGYSHFFSKNISIHVLFNGQSINDTLTNDIVSFEQLGPDFSAVSKASDVHAGPGIRWVFLCKHIFSLSDASKCFEWLVALSLRSEPINCLIILLIRLFYNIFVSTMNCVPPFRNNLLLCNHGLCPSCPNVFVS